MHAIFVALALPANVRVPAGALDKHSGNPTLLARSRHLTSLDDQVVALKQKAEIIDAELFDSELPQSEHIYLNACFQSGLFTKGMYKRHVDEHPSNIAGLAAAGELLLTQRPMLMMNALATFLAAKQRVLHALRERFGASVVFVPPIFDLFDFLLDPAAVSKAHDLMTNVRDYLCTRLNVIRLPVQREGAGKWLLALLPNITGASDADVIEQVGVFYELHAARERMGTALTQEDVRNLRVVADGPGTRGLMDFLIVKFASREMRSELGYNNGRTKSIIRRYDPFTQRLRTLRDEAILKVKGKVIKTTARGVHHACAAAEYEMRRVVRKEKVRLAAWQRERAARSSHAPSTLVAPPAARGGGKTRTQARHMGIGRRVH